MLSSACLIPFTGHVLLRGKLVAQTFSQASLSLMTSVLFLLVTVSVSYIRRITNETVFVTISEVELCCMASVHTIHLVDGALQVSAC